MILAWKHHIAQHFKNDPTLIYNNYADAGGTIFTNFDRMKEYLESNTSEEYYVAPIIVYEDQISYINEHEYKLLYNIPIIGNFAPIKDWYKHDFIYRMLRSSAEENLELYFTTSNI